MVQASTTRRHTAIPYSVYAINSDKSLSSVIVLVDPMITRAHVEVFYKIFLNTNKVRPGYSRKGRGYSYSRPPSSPHQVHPGINPLGYACAQKTVRQDHDVTTPQKTPMSINQHGRPPGEHATFHHTDDGEQ
ncbi:hypothetical protein CBL_02533 [Carabus blaptoides fortunei]